MKSFKPILIVLILLVILGGGYFGYKSLRKGASKTSGEGNSPGDIIQNNGAESEKSFFGNINDLLSSGASTKCTYAVNTEGSINEGTIWVSGKNVRGDTKITAADGATTASYMILKDKTMYTWGTNMPYGIMFTSEDNPLEVDTEDTEDVEMPESVKTLQGKVDYKCTPWLTDNSLFELPDDIEFKDLSKMFPTEGTSGEQDMCSLCDFITTEEEKSACLSAYNCE